MRFDYRAEKKKLEARIEIEFKRLTDAELLNDRNSYQLHKQSYEFYKKSLKDLEQAVKSGKIILGRM